MTAFDKAWALLKMPYFIGDPGKKWPHDTLYQGHQEGETDTGYWSSDPRESLMYALFGSDLEGGSGPKTGIPAIRQANEVNEDVMLEPDPEGTGAGISQDIAHRQVPRKEVAQRTKELLSDIDSFRDVYGDDADWDETNSRFPLPVSLPFNETTANSMSMSDRQRHIEELMGFILGEGLY